MKNKKYYPALDGLRGLAILLVIFHHNFRFLNIFFFGWLGVDLFFVLSGFLITELLLDTKNNPKFLKNFYVRRVLRIFPVYYLMLIITFTLLTHSEKLNIKYYTDNQIWFWGYLQNWIIIFKEPFGDKILLHTWSLAVEEQFYIFWPLAIYFFRHPKKLIYFASFVLFILITSRFLVWSLHIEGMAYSSLITFTRIDGLCIGSILALLIHKQFENFKPLFTGTIFFLAILNFTFYFINKNQSFNLPYLAFAGYTTFAVLFGLLIYEAVSKNSQPIQYIFTTRLLRFFGKISYGLYVYHWPIYVLFYDSLINFFENNFTAGFRTIEILCGLTVTLISVIISVISYNYFEKPILKFKERFQ